MVSRGSYWIWLSTLLAFHQTPRTTPPLPPNICVHGAFKQSFKSSGHPQGEGVVCSFQYSGALINCILRLGIPSAP